MIPIRTNARAIRVFLKSGKFEISFDLIPKQNDHGRLEIELAADNGNRPVRIWFADDGFIYTLDGEMTTRIRKYDKDELPGF